VCNKQSVVPAKAGTQFLMSRRQARFPRTPFEL
jgi:hypothetical protein